MVSALASPELSAQFRISELLFNPPGNDFAAEAVELLGPPNALFTNATYLVFIEGDAGGVPGTIQNVFELSGARIGGNGFLLLLQKASPYAANPDAALRQNSGSDAGWGDGSGSSIAHRGEADRLDLENGSFSCLLLESLIEPDPGDSIDADGNGVPDGMATNWTILDSIGMLDDGGPGDISYAALTFRRNPAAQALGSVVEVDFRPGYLARQGNTPGSSPGDWLAGDVLAGALPDWVLGSGPNTAPPHVAGSPLDHWGGPNFGAPNLPGIILIPPAQAIPEGGQASMTLRLNTAPASPVLLRLASDVEVHMSLDGSSFFSVLDVHLPDTNAVEILVGAVDDTDVETSPHASAISLQMQVPSPPEYPLEMPLPDPRVSIEENDKLLISELNVNPPGTDASREYLEIVGLPGALLDGVYLLVVEGDMNDDPGTVDLLLDLSGVQVGSNGFLLVLAPDHPYTVPPLAGIHLDPALSTGGGVFPNGSVTFMLITTTDPPALDDDLDKGDNGVLEGLAEDVQLLDAVGWTDGDPDDLVFAETVINLAESTPDAAMRMGSNTWFRGSLGGGGDPLTFTGLSDGLYSLGTRLTPGETNRVGPRIVPLVPLSGVIGDPGNPGVALRLLDVGLLQGGLSFTSFSNASNVVPAANIQVQAISNDHFAVLLDPVGVGYAAVTVRVSDVSSYVDLPLSYAASDPGRPGAFWLTHASDASAALAIDQAYMLVGDDEGQAIRMYPRDRSGSPVKEFDLNPFLALTDIEDGQAREVDIEGVTRSGNQVYWLGS
ncbi:MAG: hypothetical protein VCG02_06895, partial [Verrucomicrobiota bacterium]